MKRIAASVTLLLTICVPRIGALPQTGSGPITRDELVKLIKESGPHPRQSQTDIAAEVERRGVAFELNEKTLDELKKAGAREFLIEAIRHSVEDAGGVTGSPVERESPRAGPPADSLIEETRRHVLAFVNELPNFVVNQQVTCKVRTPQTQGWQTQSTLEIELTYENPRTPLSQREWTYDQLTGESKKLIKLDGKSTTKAYRDIHVMTSAGEFGAALLLPFGRDAIFKENKHDRLRGRDTVVYDFTLRGHSLEINSNAQGTQQSATINSTGRIWIDPDAKRVTRIESSQEGLPLEKRITLWEISADYDWVMIDDRKYLLPVHAEVLTGIDAEKAYAWNVIEFVNYHKWEGSIKIAPDPK